MSSLFNRTQLGFYHSETNYNYNGSNLLFTDENYKLAHTGIKIGYGASYFSFNLFRSLGASWVGPEFELTELTMSGISFQSILFMDESSEEGLFLITTVSQEQADFIDRDVIMSGTKVNLGLGYSF